MASMVMVFDVNGTLLDSEALAPALKGIFGKTVSVEQWFGQLLQYAMAYNVVGEYRDFGDLGSAVLRMMAVGHGIEVDLAAVEEVQKEMAQLPPFPDVRKALQKLQAAKIRLAVLSNSATATLRAQVTNSDLEGYFEQVLSVDMVRRFKPAAETYTSAAEALGIETSEILMVAAHPWDLLGALRAGCRTAFVSRPGKALLPGALVPDYVATDLIQLADQVIKAEAAGQR